VSEGADVLQQCAVEPLCNDIILQCVMSDGLACSAVHHKVFVKHMAEEFPPMV
jgi:hypothetical protein